MSFPDDPRDLKVWFGFGYTDFDDPFFDVVWTQVAPNPDDEGDPGPVLGPIRIRRGRIGDAGTTDPTSIQFALRNTDGRFSPRNVAGPHYGQLRPGTPVKVTVDIGAGDQTVATANVPDFTPTREGPGLDPKVPTRALGQLSRIGRDKEIYSALRLSTLGPLLRAYWSMEDGAQGDQFGSTFPGGSPLTFGPIGDSRDSSLPGSRPLPAMTAATALRGQVPAASFTSGDWAMTWVVKFAAAPTVLTTLMEVEVVGSDVAKWVVSADSTTIYFEALDASGSTVYSNSSSSSSLYNAWFSGEWLGFAIGVDNGSDASVIAGGVGLSVLDGSIVAGAPIALTIPASAELDGTAIGHIAFYDQDAAIVGDDEMQGLEGWTAAERAFYVCDKLNIPHFISFSAESEPLGPVQPGTALSILRESEGVDHGVLYELRAGLIDFQPRAERYNGDVALTLDYGDEDGTGDIHGLAMSDDDRDTYNLVTVTRLNGISATAELDSGPVGTDTSQGGIGPRPLPVTLNLYQDSQVSQHAGWLLRLTTTGKPRYAVVLRPYSVAAIRSAVLSANIGSRIQITGAPPEDHGPDTLDLIVEGEEIEIDSTEWTVTLWCEPYEPYRVAEVAASDATASGSAADVSRHDTSGCVTAEGLWLPGTSGAYASSPDDPVLDVVGDLDIRVDVQLASYATGAVQILLSKRAGAPNNSYMLRVTAAGFLQLVWSADGTTELSALSSVPIPAGAGERISLRATLDVDNGAGGRTVAFSTASELTGMYTALGSAVTTAGTTSIASTGAQVEVGSRSNGTAERATGVFYGAQVRDGIAGTLVLNGRFDQRSTGDTAWTDSLGRSWAVSGAAKVYHDFTAGTDTDMLVRTTAGNPWTTDADDLPMPLRCSGAVLSVTAVTPASSAVQVLTVSSTVSNGVAKTIEPGEPISLAYPAALAL